MTEQRLKDETKILKRIDEIRPSNPKKSDYTHGINVGLAMAKVAIKDAPTIEERKTGKWMPVDSYSAFGGDEVMWEIHGNPIAFYYCSECKEHAYAGEDGESLLTMYCPNCGARMVQEGEDNDS